MGLVDRHPLGALITPDGSPLDTGNAQFTTLQMNKRWLALIGLPKKRN